MTKKTVLGTVKVIVSLALIGYLISIVDFSETAKRLKTADLRLISLALVFLVSQVALSAFKWQLILRSDGVQVPYLTLLRSNYIGNFFSLFLPSSFGGDVYRVIAVTSASKKLGKTTSSVLFDRVTGLFALLSIALLAFIALPGRTYDWIALVLYAVVIATFVMCTSGKAVTFLRNSRMTVVRKIAVVFESFRTYRRDYRTLVIVFLISLVFQFMVVVINKIYATSLSIDIAFSTLLVFVPLVYLTEVLPISINGIGVRDGAFVYFFLLAGQTKEEGLAVALLVLSMRYVSGLVGGLVLLFTVLGKQFGKAESAG